MTKKKKEKTQQRRRRPSVAMNKHRTKCSIANIAHFRVRFVCHLSIFVLFCLFFLTWLCRCQMNSFGRHICISKCLVHFMQIASGSLFFFSTKDEKKIKLNKQKETQCIWNVNNQPIYMQAVNHIIFSGKDEVVIKIKIIFNRKNINCKHLYFFFKFIIPFICC